ncbi:hypothetical protein CGC20_23975 [Leishmania donovani]|uniref:Uncharacterized protein n=1 Tax=Leishmania donovani TaxID=5661 RepID=A0A504X5P4_LEIDO|nr:hypothetical protein CGC20_23975 [Leishmania donovani]
MLRLDAYVFTLLAGAQTALMHSPPALWTRLLPATLPVDARSRCHSKRGVNAERLGHCAVAEAYVSTSFVCDLPEEALSACAPGAPDSSECADTMPDGSSSTATYREANG